VQQSAEAWKIGTSELQGCFFAGITNSPGRGTSADERGQETSRGDPWVRGPAFSPASPISVVKDLHCKLEVPGDTAITFTSVTARWPIVKGVLSKLSK